MQRVTSFKSSDGSLHLTKERCAAQEINNLVGDDKAVFAHVLVTKRRRLIEILEWVDQAEDAVKR